MFCPSCRAEFRPGVTFCKTCEVALCDTLPQDDFVASPERMEETLRGQELSAIAVGNEMASLEGQRVLAIHQLASIIESETEGELPTALHAKYYLLVADKDLVEAQAVLRKQWEMGGLAHGLVLREEINVSAGKCPACGAPLPDDMVECADCGLHVGA